MTDAFKSIEQGLRESIAHASRDDALLDRIKAHRSAPDVYDPPTFDEMADRIFELEMYHNMTHQDVTIFERTVTGSRIGKIRK